MPRKRSFLQDLACCDNNRTLVDFRALDIYRIVGDMQDSDGHQNAKMTMIYHHRDSIRPEDNITMLTLSRFY